jgi:hypothetical protein
MRLLVTVCSTAVVPEGICAYLVGMDWEGMCVALVALKAVMVLLLAAHYSECFAS